MSSTPTITLMAYRQPTVNGELLETVIRTASGPLILAGSKDFFRRFSADVVALVGTPTAPPPPGHAGRKLGQKSKVSRARVTPERLAAIQRAVAEVAAGHCSQVTAATALCLTRSAFTSWVHRLEENKRLGRPTIATGTA